MKNKHSNLGKRLGVMTFSAMLCLLANAQARRVTGLIVDQSGEPIIGASVKVQDSSKGVITDFEGKFSLEVPEGKKLIISYIGYVGQTITPKGDNLVINMQEDTQSIDEVVVVGYGSMKQKNVTGSVTTISTKDLEDLPTPTLLEALDGEINGLHIDIGSSRPGGSAGDVYIRQARNLNGLSKDGGNNNPLVIVDDVMQLDENGYSDLSPLTTLDPSEVESITVLRDASAAIYGSRAANGAIIIKTKRGKAGIPRISYSGKFAINDAISHPKVLHGSDYGRFYNSVMRNSNRLQEISDAYLFSDDELAAMDETRYNWLDKADWKPAFQQTHTLNVSGGSERATYFASASFFDQGANLAKQDYQRFTYRAGVDIQLTNDVKLSASVSGNESNKHTMNTKSARFKQWGNASGTADYNVLAHMPDYIPWSVELPNDLGEMETYWLGPYAAPYSSKLAKFDKNSIQSWNYFALTESGSYNDNQSDGWTANISLTYEVPFIKGLSLRATYSTSHSTSSNEQLMFPYEVAYLNALPAANQHLPSNIPTESYATGTSIGDAQATFTGSSSKSQQMNFYVNYNRTFGKHTVGAMFSIERSEAKNRDYQLAYRNNIPEDFEDIFTGSAKDGMLQEFLDPSMAVLNKGQSGSLSYLGRVTYSYADRYMLEFLFRTDASVKFAPENYWGFFPSVSAGWVISEESWFKEKLPWFELLKVRASWGKLGRDSSVKGLWQWKQTFAVNTSGFQFGDNGGINASGLLPGNVSPNRNLHWDTVHKMNLGFDMSFLSGRLGLTWDLYYDINTDIVNQKLAQQPGVPIYAGGSYAQENFGRIDTYGTEISINWRDRIGEVNYNVGLSFGFDDNRVREWVPGLNDGKYPADRSDLVEGQSTNKPTWGFKVWKGTSTGDGILRTQADIDAYWNYLSVRAAAAGTTPSYLGIENKDEMPLGALAYQDLGGEMVGNEQQGPNGQIEDVQDFAEMCKGNSEREMSGKIGFSWKSLSFRMNLSASWGGVNFIDRTKMTIDKHDKVVNLIWSPDSFWKDMYDPITNPDGKYPNYGVETRTGGSVFAESDFWEISNFRLRIRNITVSYTLPKEWVKPLFMQSVRLNLSGQNLWDLYNPYPDHYRNMYCNSAAEYPTLRTWSLGVNISF